MNNFSPRLTRPPTKAGLSTARRRLLEAMQQVDFGHIKDLTILGGEPCFNPSPKVVREIKMGAENGPRPELAFDDFILKSQVVELFTHLSQLDDSCVEIEVRHGLPFRLIVEQAA